METYITNQSWATTKNTKKGIEFGILIPERSILVVDKKDSKNVFFYHQGHDKTKLNIEVFNSIPKSEIKLQDDFIYDWVIKPQEYNLFFNKVSKLKKLHSKDSRLVKWLKKIVKDVQQTHGSPAINGEEYSKYDPNNTGWTNGFTAKPYSWEENRSGRTTVSPRPKRISEFESKSNIEVLPLGIDKSQQCSYSSQIELTKKLLKELSGVDGIPESFKSDMRKLGLETSKGPHYDYMEFDYHIKLEDIDKNEHHSKEKGIEFCHFDPKDGTNAKNVTLGLSKSNRAQSGNSVFQMGFKGVNAERRSLGLKTLTEEEYRQKFLV